MKLNSMERVNRIIKNDKFRNYLLDIDEWEKDRIFCRHQMDHFLGVARIAVLICHREPENHHLLESEELIYAAALLHDIGRGEQYRTGRRHEAISAELASEILQECGFEKNEMDTITSAIATHREQSIAGEHTLNGVLYRADKLSRNCFCCRVAKDCDKEETKRTMYLHY